VSLLFSAVIAAALLWNNKRLRKNAENAGYINIMDCRDAKNFHACNRGRTNELIISTMFKVFFLFNTSKLFLEDYVAAANILFCFQGIPRHSLEFWYW
jgi:hypothetical protein